MSEPNGSPQSAVPDGAPPRELATTSVRHPLTRSLLLLTVTTGVVDAVSYLGLGHVFSANMTGNVVLLGFGIANSGGLPVVAPLVSLAAFLVGAGAGGVVASRIDADDRIRLVVPLAIEVLLIAVGAVLAATIDIHPSAPSGDTVIALLALAMGVRNASARRVGVPDVTTTVLTMTLTGLAAELPIFGGNGKGSVRRTASVIAMLTGAIVGALLLKVQLWLALVAAAALTLVTVLGYELGGRRRSAVSAP